MTPLDCQKIFDALPGLYIVLSVDFTIVAASTSFLNATFSKREDVIGKNVFEMFPSGSMESASNSRAVIERVISLKKPEIISLQRYDLVNYESERKPLEERYWRSENSPVLGENGDVSFVVVRVEDATEFVLFKRREEEIQKQNEELHTLAKRSEMERLARTRELEQANQSLHRVNVELARLYQKSKELSNAKASFFANVSHELRTPLELILGAVEKILSGNYLDNTGRGTLRIALRNARLLHRRIDDLLDVEKIESGKIAVEYVVGDLSQLVRLVAEPFHALAAEQSMAFFVETPKSLIVQFDPEKIQRIILNLLSNALRSTQNGGRVRCTIREDRREKKVLIEVADSGPGIARQNDRDEIFRQADSGLDLTIARELAMLQGGTLTMDSAPEGGACFTVSLPLVLGTETSGSTLPEEVVLAAHEKILDEEQHAKVLTLLVEENRDLNSLIMQSLFPEFTVESTHSVAEALVKAKYYRPDIILTDCMMPEISGDKLENIPVIVLTEQGDEDLRMRLFHAGARDLLVKPFSIEELRMRLRNILEARRADERSAHLYEDLLREKTKADALLIAFESSDRISTRFQEAALPTTLPIVEGVRFGAYYQPGPSDSSIGGDWYDAFRLADGRVVLSIGDVGGSGLGASVIMAALRNVIRGVAYINPDPTMILEAAGKILCAEYPDMYVSAFVGILDPIVAEFSYASAGHPPPLLRYADGTIEELTYKGTLLGVTVVDNREVKRLKLDAGSLLVLYTDGLIEATHDIAALEGRLREALHERSVLRAENVAQAIYDLVLTEPSKDDVAILTVWMVASPILSDATREGRFSRWIFDAEDAAVSRRARGEFAGKLRVFGASDDEVGSAETIFGELVGNVARYAPGEVEVLVDWGGSAPVLHVRDHGPGFAYAPRLPRDPLAENGRGLYIVAALAEDCSVTRSGDRGSHARVVLAVHR